MDRETGRIMTPEQMQVVREMFAARSTQEQDYFRRRYKKMTADPTPAQLKRRPPRIGRNEPCPCGSGKKFKHCCLLRLVQENPHG